ncbi:uncharacterized protein [Drosophila tropicalis]|uniref:uncharacterized protein n=1 Tax=Drosophila tropicalis TaxID=46794 RepID=UPI0035AB879E
MLFMESYLCYCSVRLGVLIVSLINIIKCLAFSIYLFVHGIASYHPLVELFEQDAQYAENRVVRKYIHWIENYPDKVLIYNQVLLYLWEWSGNPIQPALVESADSKKRKTIWQAVEQQFMDVEIVLGEDFCKQAEVTISYKGLRVTKTQCLESEVSSFLKINVDDSSEQQADIDPAASKRAKEAVQNLVQNYHPVSEKSTNIQMRLVLNDDKPIYSRPRRFSYAERCIIDNQTDQWLKDGIIEISESDPTYSNIAAALLASFGSFKLYKWLLLPLALFELMYLIQFTSFHIVLMIVLKKLINLGLLIVLTLVGSFYILFEGYNCVTCLAMFQIISLVKSQRYRELYGNDPFHPLALKRAPNNSYSKDSVQQLRILDTPDDTDIDEQKRLAKLGLWPRRQPQVISVIPAQAPMPQLKWWQQQALDKDDKLQDSKIYRNWQPNELLSGVGGEVQRKNALNRRYAEGELYRWY